MYYNIYKSIMYLTVSADPFSPPTVENLTATGVCLPMLENKSALQYCVISCVTSKYPNAPKIYISYYINLLIQNMIM